MANYEATRYDWDGQYLTSVQGVNTGVIIPWGSSSIPSGFLECNGTAVSRTTYATLFSIIGTTYGTGDGSTTFNLPDLTDRTVVTKSNNKALASTGGANTVTPTGNIGSASLGNTALSVNEIPSHNHTFPDAAGGGEQVGNGSPNAGQGSVGNSSNPNSNNAGCGGSHGHTINAANFVGDSASVLQPYLVLIYIIKT